MPKEEKMKNEIEILEEFIKREKEGCRIGSGDDGFYEKQIDKYVDEQRGFLLNLIKFALSGGNSA